MAYTKTVWQTGDVITAAKLNNAEDGIEALQPFIVSLTDSAPEAKKGNVKAGVTYYADKSYSEITAAADAGKVIIFMLTDEIGKLCGYFAGNEVDTNDPDNPAYNVYTTSNDFSTFTAASEDALMTT